MSLLIVKIEIKYEHDIVLARQRARTIADLLGFDAIEQTRISTAVSEITRNAFNYAGGGDVRFLVEGKCKPQIFIVQINDCGPGIEDVSAILEGRYRSTTGMGIGISGVHKLMDYFHIESAPDQGTKVVLGKTIPSAVALVDARTTSRIAEQLIRQAPQNPYEEIQRQNQEVLRAMNELRQRQEQLEALNQELEDTNRGVIALYAELDEKAVHLNRVSDLKTSFLSNMSHEFRTPLNSILSLSQILLDRLDGDLTAEQEKQVKFIRKAAEELSVLINDLLDIAKIEAGKIVINPVEFDLGNLFSALRGMLKPVLVNPAVQLVIEEPKNIPSMISDEGKISQILRNLIANAIKFTERGEIRVTASSSDHGKRVVFRVSDTGIGIEREYHEAIFEEYTQVDTHLQRKQKGSGLGLPLSKKLAELLGGKITLQSAPGLGSTFTVTMPLHYKDKEYETKAPAADDIMKYPVLVIEDDETTVALYEKFLKGSGFQVLSACNLKEARDRLKEVSPVAIILDILLKGEESWSFLTELKSSDNTRNIPVYIATVLDDHEKGVAFGAEDVATKPVERIWLLSKLREITQGAMIEKVLIIDDEEVARYLMKGLLADTKYQILEASGGEAGLKIAVEEHPDIIFLDLVMPGMDGFETLERLKSSSKTRDIPVIIVTSKLMSKDELQILNDRTLAIISKGLTSREEIIGKIRDAIKAWRGRNRQKGECE